MLTARGRWVPIVLATFAFLPSSAYAVLGFSEQSGLESLGRVDLDSFGPSAPLSNKQETEITLPFPRSIVSVADSQPGVFAYSSSSDIGTLALRLSGTLTNSSGVEFFGQGVPILQVTAQVLDVITLTSTLPGSFDVTLELVVNGSIIATGGSVSASANSLLQFGPEPGTNTTESSLYPIGAISETLSITREVSGPTVDMDFNAFLSFNVLSVAPGASVTGELSNTAFLNLILPAGVAVTGSGSGTFGVPIPIPEPHEYALMLCGLSLIGVVVRRRRRSIQRRPR